MSEQNSENRGEQEVAEAKPFVAPCRKLEAAAPIEWLKSGWRDFRSAPGLSLAWGGMCWFLSTIITWLSWIAGGWVLLLSVLSGFIFIGPLLAFGMYSVSRQLCLGNRPDLFHTLKAARKPFANALVLLHDFITCEKVTAMIPPE